MFSAGMTGLARPSFSLAAQPGPFGQGMTGYGMGGKPGSFPPGMAHKGGSFGGPRFPTPSPKVIMHTNLVSPRFPVVWDLVLSSPGSCLLREVPTGLLRPLGWQPQSQFWSHSATQGHTTQCCPPPFPGDSSVMGPPPYSIISCLGWFG